MTLTIDRVLAPKNVEAAWRATKKTAQFAHVDADGNEVAGDEQDLARLFGGAPFASHRELLADVIDLGHLGAGFGREYHLDHTAEAVCPIDIDGREVYGHCIRIRVLQRAFVQVAGPVIEKVLPPTVFSYRPRRDRFAALLAARLRIRRGDVFVAKIDVRGFFPSVRAQQVWDALATLAPELDESIRRLAVWFCTAPIARPGPRLDPALNALYQGSIVAPLLSNIVGAHLVDLPFAQYAPCGVRALRYGDDVITLGADVGAVNHARDIVVQLIEDGDWRTHAHKTDGCARDLRCAPFVWLGKRVSVDGVSTPREKIIERIDALVSLPHGDERVGTMAAALVNELFLDRAAAIDAVVAEVATLSPRRARAVRRLRKHLAPARRRRMRHYNSLVAPAFTRA
jgi:hypothetical protein